MTEPLRPTHLSDDALNEYLDQALPPGAMTRAQSHLAACAACTKRLDALRALFADLETLPEVALARDLSPTVVRALNRPSPTPLRPTVEPRHPLYRLLFPLQALVAVVLLALTWPLVASRAGDLSVPALSFVSDLLAAVQAAASFTNGAGQLWAELQSGLTAGWSLFQSSTPLAVPVQLLLAVAAGTGLLWLVTNLYLLQPQRGGSLRRSR